MGVVLTGWLRPCVPAGPVAVDSAGPMRPSSAPPLITYRQFPRARPPSPATVAARRRPKSAPSRPSKELLARVSRTAIPTAVNTQVLSEPSERGSCLRRCPWVGPRVILGERFKFVRGCAILRGVWRLRGMCPLHARLVCVTRGAALITHGATMLARARSQELALRRRCCDCCAPVCDGWLLRRRLVQVRHPPVPCWLVATRGPPCTPLSQCPQRLNAQRSFCAAHASGLPAAVASGTETVALRRWRRRRRRHACLPNNLCLQFSRSWRQYSGACL